jgi:hypothetical protein
MAKEVKIPVRAEGAEKAQADLKKTGQAVKEVGEAGKASAAGTREATGAVQEQAGAQSRAGRAIKDTTEAIGAAEKAWIALRAVLGFVNPAIGRVVMLAKSVAGAIKASTAALVGLIGAGLAITGVIVFFERLNDKIAETKRRTDELIERWAKLRGQFGDVQETMADVLQRFGALTPATEKAAGEMRRRLERAGFKPATVAAISPLAVMEGLSPADAALAAQLQVMGARFEEPGDIRKVLDRMRKQAPDKVPAAQRQIEELAKTETGKKRRAIAAGQPLGGVQYTAEERAYWGLAASGAIGEEVSLADFRRNVDEARRLTEGLRRLKERGAIGMERRHVYPDELWGGRSLIFEPDIQKRLRELQGPMILGVIQREQGRERAAQQPFLGALPGGSVEVPTVVYYHDDRTVNQGVVYNSLGMVEDPWHRDPELLQMGPGAP